MVESNFIFVKDAILRQNLDDAFAHILVLLPLLESVTYNDGAKSSFRKTIIIYTASIIEALLFYVVDTEIVEQALKTYSWELQNKKVLHKVSGNHEIVAGDFKRMIIKTKKEKLNLGQICTLLRDERILTKPLFDKVDAIRELRNSQHFGLRKEVRSFSKKDLERAFSVASEIKNFVRARAR